MKKINLLLIFIILLPYIAFAENVTVEKAQKIAESFLNGQIESRGAKVGVSLVWNGETNQSRTSNHAPAYYVFESSEGGFVIVAGDDVVKPILGYSKEGGFDVNDMPENLKWWMNELRGGINYLREKTIKQDNETRTSWENIANGAVASRAVESEKLLETAKWNQTYPFNNMCPTIDGKNTYVGCVPTAMAIMMRYYRWPESGTGYLEDYEYTDEQGNTRYINGYFLGHKYEWDKMPLDFSDYTKAQADAVAQLMKDCAVAAQAEFDPVGSGGSSANMKDAMYALIKYMSYDASAFYYEKEMFTDIEWRRMLYQSIDGDAPVWYSGNSKTSGHSFILDGYNSTGFFHINWGWGGEYNGYFDFPNFRNYNIDHEAVMGLKKDEGGDFLEIMALGKNSSNTCTGIKFSSGDGYQVEKGVPFEITFGRLSNDGLTNFTGAISVVIINKKGEQKEVLNTFRLVDVKPRYGWNNRRVTCTVTQEIEIGDRIKLFYKSDNSDEWEPVWYVKEAGFVGELPIADQYYIEEVTSFEYRVEDKQIEIVTKPEATWSLQDSTGASINNGITFEEGILIIETSTLEAGTYTLTLSKGKDNKELNFIIGGK